MRLVETAILYPNACLCGHGRGPFIDTGIDKPVLGHLYLCTELCVAQAARAAGGGTADDFAQAEALLSDAQEQIEQLKQARQEQRRELVHEIAEHVLRESGEKQLLTYDHEQHKLVLPTEPA